jgi:hypothetical protein
MQPGSMAPPQLRLTLHCRLTLASFHETDKRARLPAIDDHVGAPTTTDSIAVHRMPPIDAPHSRLDKLGRPHANSRPIVRISETQRRPSRHERCSNRICVRRIPCAKRVVLDHRLPQPYCHIYGKAGPRSWPRTPAPCDRVHLRVVTVAALLRVWRSRASRRR